MLLNICFLQCLQKLLLALVTIFLVLQIISWVWASSLFDIWFDLFHEFIVYGDFASHFSPFTSKNRGSDGRPCLNNFCENFFFPLLRSQEGPCSHSPTPSLFFVGYFVWVLFLQSPDQVRDWQDEVEFWPGCGWRTELLPLWDLSIHSLHSVNIYEASPPGQDLRAMSGGLDAIPVLAELTVCGGSQTVKQAMTIRHDEWDGSGS